MVNLYMVKFLEQGNSDEKESIFFLKNKGCHFK